MARKGNNPHAWISPTEAERAIYIDCEGMQDQSPVLIGVQIEGSLEQIVLDKDLKPVAEARGHPFSSFGAEAERILKHSLYEARPIVAYSQHELHLFDEYAGRDIRAQYRNALLIARRWRSILHPELKMKSNELKEFLEIIGYERPKHLGDHKTTKRIRDVRDMVAFRGTYDALTGVKKRHWTNLLNHNRIDCDGMRALVMKCAIELESHKPKKFTRAKR